MVWAIAVTSVGASIYLYIRLRRVERDMRSMMMRWHDAAGRAMRRERRDRWRFRHVDGILRLVCHDVLPGLDVPDLLEGPPDDPDTPTSGGL